MQYYMHSTTLQRYVNINLNWYVRAVTNVLYEALPQHGVQAGVIADGLRYDSQDSHV